MQQPNQPIEQDEVPASPEEEQQLQQATDVALNMIHAEGSAGDNIAAMVLKNQDVVKGLGQAIATVVIGVEKQAQLSEDVKLALAENVAEELVNLAIQAGAISEDEVDDEFIDKVVSHAISDYMSMKDALGELDKGALEAGVNEAQSMVPQKKPKGQGGLLEQVRG